MNKKTILLCMGTRPEVIKMAPVYHALRAAEFNPMVLHTGQHGVLTDTFYEFFKLKPDYKYELSRDNTELGHLFAMMIEHIDKLIGELKPDAVLVQGDTSSAFAGALGAYYHKIPVGHVEAGLRSHHDYEPYPEEKNREMVARLARWHFAPTTKAMKNLEQEGIPNERRFLVGNTIVDSVNWTLRQQQTQDFAPSEAVQAIFRRVADNNNGSRLMLVTAHRRESWDGEIEQIAAGVRNLVQRYPDIQVVWPVHPNPVVKKAVHKVLAGFTGSGIEQRVWLTDPLNYSDLIRLLQHAWLVLTDSGGIQEEAVTLNVPVLILRNTTERSEVIDVGGGALVGTTAESIMRWVESLSEDAGHYASMKSKTNPFGDGHAADYIAARLKTELGNVALSGQMSATGDRSNPQGAIKSVTHYG